MAAGPIAGEFFVMQDGEHQTVAVAGESDEEVVFRQRPFYRNLGLGWLIHCLLLVALSAQLIWTDLRHDRSVIAGALFGSFWLALSGIGALILLRYWRGRLIVHKDFVRIKGAFSSEQVDLREVTAVRWQMHQLTLVTPEVAMGVSLSGYKSADPLWLIRRIRNRFPASVQEGWEKFCYRTAVPLLIAHEIIAEKELDEMRSATGDVVIVHRRGDWYFVPAIIIGIVICLVTWWQTQFHWWLVFTAVLVLFWLCLRFGTARRKLVIRVTPEEQRTFLLLVLALPVTPAVAHLAKFAQGWLPGPVIVGVIAIVIALWLIVVFRATSRRCR